MSKSLEGLFGENVNLGTGCIFCINGHTSKQQDIVVSERNFGVSFPISDSPSVTYFPCETTIACGEVKSTLTVSALQDIFEKCHSVKSLTRQTTAEKCLTGRFHPFRNFGSPIAISPSHEEQFDQKSNDCDQIFFFAVAGKNALSKNRLIEEVERARSKGISHLPNMVITLDGTILCFAKEYSGQLVVQSTPVHANGPYVITNHENPFGHLAKKLRSFISRARTVPLKKLDNYFSGGKIEGEYFRSSNEFFGF